MPHFLMDLLLAGIERLLGQGEGLSSEPKITLYIIFITLYVHLDFN